MKFRILNSITEEFKKSIENKKVCDVVEFRLSSPDGIYKGWMGSVEDAYFSTTFVKGIISISISEREMCLGWVCTSYAVIDKLYDVLSGKITLNTEYFIDEYNSKNYLNDVQSITFKDVMKVYKWKFKSRKVKVEQHFLN